jgi:hypothetical protein
MAQLVCVLCLTYVSVSLSQEMSVLQEMVYHAHCESCIKVSFPFAPYLYSQLTHNAVNLILDIQMHQENY